VSRRLLFATIAVGFNMPAFARTKLGDGEWMRRFREFIKAFNAFVEALDDGKLDRAKWERMRAEWHQLEQFELPVHGKTGGTACPTT
jgi:hypothetical protein